MNEAGELTLFNRLAELDAPARDAELAFLETTDSGLATRLRRLLAAHDQPLLRASIVPTGNEIPASIGPYRVLERLGRGGMGDVWLCEQSQPVQRKVAVKVLRAGLDTHDVLARFDAERQALALMTHPNIARMLDAGETAEGRPFFVMEYVPGVPLLRYCDENRLALKQRLRLFMTVCTAVQHAHQKGIIHRDIKPSNILVTRDGDVAIPHVIDFGIAKALGTQLTGRTLHTLNGNLVGTPAYMSPEQADIGAVDVDTRTDIYSLGVVLYELVSGSVPFRFTGTQHSLSAIQRTLRTAHAPPPSRKLLELPNANERAQARGIARATTLAAQLRGDLDAITLKALQKHRARRYASATELADDVARHLSSQPVFAARPGALYLFGKFLRRNAVAVTGSALLAMTLIAFSLYATFQARQLAAERDHANQQAAKARQIGEFFAGMFAATDSGAQRHPGMTVREALDIGAHRAEEGLAHQPDVQVALLHAIGRVYSALGLYADAERTLSGALASTMADARHVVDAPLVRRVRIENARALLLQERFGELEPLLVRMRAEFPKTDSIDRQHAELLLAELYLRTARQEEAERLMRDIVAVTDHADPASAEIHGLALLLLGQLLAESSRFDEARPLLERGIGLLGALSMENSPEVIYARGVLMWAMTMQGGYDEARTYVEETLEISRRIYGEEHPATAMAYSDLSFVMFEMKDYANAERTLLTSLDTTVRTLGEYHSRTAITLNNLASVYDSTGKPAEALPLYRRVLEIDTRLVGPESSEVAGTLQNIGYLLLRENRAAEAEDHLRRAVAILRKAYPDDHWMLANAQRGLGIALLRQQRFAQAEPELCEAYALFDRSLGTDHDRTRASAATLAELYASWRQADASITASGCP